MDRNNRKIQEVIATFTGVDNPPQLLLLPSDLIHFVKSPAKAAVLAQIIYLSDRGKRKDGLIFKTYEEMFEATGVKEDTWAGITVVSKKTKNDAINSLCFIVFSFSQIPPDNSQIPLRPKSDS